jgi:hypothetical protein
MVTSHRKSGIRPVAERNDSPFRHRFFVLKTVRHDKRDREEGMSMETVFISSHVKLPANTTSQEIYKFLAIAVEVDMCTGIIMRVELSLITELGRDFVSRIAYGYNLNDGIDGLIEKLRTRYFGYSRKAIETGFKLIFCKYEEIIANRANDGEESPFN